MFSILLLIELLQLHHLVFKLSCHLVDLCTLHVLMVHMVPLDLLIYSILLVVFVHVVDKLVSLTEFVYHKLLELDNVDHIEQGLHLI